MKLSDFIKTIRSKIHLSITWRFSPIGYINDYNITVERGNVVCGVIPDSALNATVVYTDIYGVCETDEPVVEIVIDEDCD